MAGLSHIDYACAHAPCQRIRRDSDRIRMMQTLQVMQALGVSANEAVDDSALAPAVVPQRAEARAARRPGSCLDQAARAGLVRDCDVDEVLLLGEPLNRYV